MKRYAMGPQPKHHLTTSKDGAVDAVIKQVRSLCESGYSAADIAIIYRRKDPAISEMIHQLKMLDILAYWITATEETKQDYDVKSSWSTEL